MNVTGLYQVQQRAVGDKPVVFLFKRNADRTKDVQAISTFKPYLYVKKDVFDKLPSTILYEEATESAKKTIFNERAVKVTFSNLERFNAFKQLVRENCGADMPYYVMYESDISLDLRYLIDEVDEMTAQKYNLLTFDIETDTSQGFPDSDNPVEPITSIAIHDSFSNEMHVFAWREDIETRHFRRGIRRVHYHYFNDEKEMLRSFLTHWNDCDADIVTAWNLPFDIGYLYARLQRLSLNVEMLSPIKQSFPFPKAYKSKSGNISIFGLVLFDALPAYKKMHFGELNSFSLNSVANEELGTEKDPVSNPGITWREDFEKLVQYNIKDVELVIKILEKTKIISIFEDIKNFAGVRNINDCFYASRIHETRIMRKYRDVIFPTKRPFQEKSAETMISGAYVMEPTPGMYKNVVVFDFKSLYPSLIYTFNLSTEMVSEHGTEILPGLKIDMSHKGIMPSMIKELVQLKDDMKNVVKGTGQSVADKMFAIKTFINSFYGINALTSFRLYNKDVAGAITALGQKFIKSCNEYVEKTFGYRVVYNDTDSVFVEINEPDYMVIQIAEAIGKALNKHVQDILAGYGLTDNTMSMEMEKVFSSIILFKKKRYAGIINWEDGEKVDKLKMAGVAARRSDSSAHSKFLQKDLLTKVLRGMPSNEALIYCKDNVDSICDGKLSYEDIGIPVKLNKAIEDYPVSNTPKLRAVRYSNKELGTRFMAGQKFLMIYTKLPKTDCVAFESHDQVAHVPIDKFQMCDKVLLQKVKGLFDTLKWDKQYTELFHYARTKSDGQGLLSTWV